MKAGFIALTGFSVILAGLSLVLTGGCSESTNSNGDDIIELEPIEGVAQDISLYFYADSTGDQVGIKSIDGEGTVNMYVDPYDTTMVINGYYIYAFCDGYFTELYHCAVGEAVNVDLDSCPDYQRAVAGTITIDDPYSEDVAHRYLYYSNSEVMILLPNGGSKTIMTDSQGRFYLGNMPEGVSTLRIEYEDRVKTYNVNVGTGIVYTDIKFYNATVSYAPDIYLYPEEDMNVHVELGFPDGGKVLKSEPEYGDGWDVFVTKDGIIDNRYGYLFYEALTPDINNNDRGWVYSMGELSDKLPKLLYDYGFEGREIGDFMEFWLPLLDKSPYYAFYPQEVDEMISLEIKPRPESVLRVLFYVEPLNGRISLPAPSIGQRFERNGFTAVEWGVTGCPELVEE